MSTVHCERALVDGRVRAGVRVEVLDGTITSISSDHDADKHSDHDHGSSAGRPGGDRRPGDVDLAGVVVPAFANTHSHLFHRGLRGATDGEDFWSWREQMYRLASRLDPDSYHRLARAAMAEMLDAGYTSLGEFHYVHHRPDATVYPHHEMEMALAHAALDAGMRLTLLDTCYLHSGLGPHDAALAPEQARFGDATVAGWLERWHRLRAALPAGVGLGAALHSVRAVGPDEIARAVTGLPPEVALHVHVSEQPKENEDCRAATGLSPTQVRARAGALSGRTTAVHATHLDDADIEALAATGTGVSLCPSTEADLGDGIARIADLLEAGVPVSIGSDQNVVTDPFAELRLLESTARLSQGRRGVVAPTMLWTIGTAQGLHSLDPRRHPAVPAGTPAGLRVGDPADLVAIDPGSARLAGVDPLRYPLTATSADVHTTVVGGRVAAHCRASELREALAALTTDPEVEEGR